MIRRAKSVFSTAMSASAMTLILEAGTTASAQSAAGSPAAPPPGAANRRFAG